MKWRRWRCRVVIMHLHPAIPPSTTCVPENRWTCRQRDGKNSHVPGDTVPSVSHLFCPVHSSHAVHGMCLPTKECSTFIPGTEWFWQPKSKTAAPHWSLICPRAEQIWGMRTWKNKMESCWPQPIESTKATTKWSKQVTVHMFSCYMNLIFASAESRLL